MQRPFLGNRARLFAWLRDFYAQYRIRKEILRNHLKEMEVTCRRQRNKVSNSFYMDKFVNIHLSNMKRTNDAMINIAMFDINLVHVFQTYCRVQRFLALIILLCAWTSCVKRHSFHRDRTGRNTFPLVVVVCHRTDTCSFVRRYCLTNRNRYLVVAWQSEWHNSASVTTGLVIRGPLLSPCGST